MKIGERNRRDAFFCFMDKNYLRRREDKKVKKRGRGGEVLNSYRCNGPILQQWISWNFVGLGPPTGHCMWLMLVSRFQLGNLPDSQANYWVRMARCQPKCTGVCWHVSCQGNLNWVAAEKRKRCILAICLDFLSAWMVALGALT